MNKIKNKNKFGFTLAEVMVVFTIIAIVAVVSSKIVKSQMNFATKYLYYAAFTNMQSVVGNLVADGYKFTDNIVHTGLWTTWDNPTATATTSVGVCQRMVKVLNLINVDTLNQFYCTPTFASNTDFKAATPNFITINGMRYFNSGNAPSPYKIYIDINGNKGKGVLDDDVFAFLISTNGVVRPDPASVASDSTKYLSTTYRYWDTTNSKYVIVDRNASFKTAVCATGVSATVPVYSCSVAVDSHCSTTPNLCDFSVNPPSF